MSAGSPSRPPLPEPRERPIPLSRRAFVGALTAGVVAGAAGTARGAPPSPAEEAGPGGLEPGDSGREGMGSRGPADRFDPWVEVDAEALRQNAAIVARLAGDRPVLAVVKNNAYGLGLALTAPVLEALPAIAGFAVVKTEEALALRDAGIRKPVLLMGMFPDEAGEELARRDVRLSLYTDDALDRIGPLARALGRPIPAHLYLDTGMGRMGMPYHRAAAWIDRVTRSPAVRVEGTYMAFTEDADFDREQLSRFRSVTADATARGMRLGSLHAASSNGVYHLPDAALDMVRPGIALYGAYPSRPDDERRIAPLHPAVSLKARVVRVERLRPGDSVSYGRSYVARTATWTATLPVGHADGYTRRAVEGARVLVAGRTHPVIGAVSASHAIVELGPGGPGEEPGVRVGDVATLVGWEHPDIHPNEVARRTGTSVYDVLMHLGPDLPRVVVGG